MVSSIDAGNRRAKVIQDRMASCQRMTEIAFGESADIDKELCEQAAVKPELYSHGGYRFLGAADTGKVHRRIGG